MGMAAQTDADLQLSRLADAELVRLAREGSLSAKRLIVRRHNQRLYRVARAILRDDTEAEDALQDAYVSAFRSLAAFRGEAMLSTWLTRIVVNEALGRLRSRTRTVAWDDLGNRAQQEAEVEGLSERASQADPETSAARSQIRRLLERAIDDLPAPFRVVFVMRMVEQLSVKETASVLGVPEETVKTRLFRARKLLREGLETELGSVLSDTFPFQDPRCAEFTDRLLARVAAGGEPAGPPTQRCKRSVTEQ